MLAERFGLTDAARTSKAVFLSELEALLRRRSAVGETTVLIVDEAQSLPLELLEEIRLLVNIETNEEKLISVIIAGQPELSIRLGDSALRQLKQRVALRCELRPLNLRETAAYLAGRVKAAGGQGARVFTREAVTLIHERSLGIPRTVNVLADNALLTSFAAGQRPVTRQIVLEVCRDFDLANIEGFGETEPTEVLGTPDQAGLRRQRLLGLDDRQGMRADSGVDELQSDQAHESLGARSFRRWRFFS